MTSKTLTRKRNRPLGRIELIAVALGGMIGGGIFSILGVAVSIVGNAAPFAILLGGVLAFFAAYSYVKLAALYKDEGATYSFFRRTYPQNSFASSVIGWLVVFGYISTLALYAFTFASYFAGLFSIDSNIYLRELIAIFIILIFAIINIVSVRGMGKIEDLLVYTKVAILLVISGLFLHAGKSLEGFRIESNEFSLNSLMIVAAITFVAFEGFQLVIHAYNEAVDPDRNIPFAIYSAIASALVIYLVLAFGALAAIPKALLIRDKEFALAAGASEILGKPGHFVVIFGALLATSSAISGTLFGASRLMAVIANDGHFPKYLGVRTASNIPRNAILTMSCLSVLLLLMGGLETILEFGSITFIVVSALMAQANLKISAQTKSNSTLAALAFVGLCVGAISLLYYEFKTEPQNLLFITFVYGMILFLAVIFGLGRRNKSNP